MNYFVTAIGTDSGKTVVSAILCQALGASYWKPVQAGFPTDSETIRQLVASSDIKVYPETYVFKTAASPHAAAALENITIKLEDFAVPKHSSDLIIEGAGGTLVPLNDENLVIDLVPRFNASIILVANLYLGSINHTLLTYEAISRRDIPVKGIVFNGLHNSESERIILLRTGLQLLLHVDQEKHIDEATVKKYANKLIANWNG